MKILFISLVALFGFSTVFGQGEWVSGSINVGSTSNSTALIIRTTNAFDANKVGNIVFTVRVPKTAGAAVVIVEDATKHNAAFSHISFVVQRLVASDATYWYYLVNGTGNVQAAAGTTIAANTPTVVTEIKYAGGTTNGVVQLCNIENDLPGNGFIRPQFYIENNLGEITNLTAMFYGTGGAVAQNNVAPNGDDFVPTPAPVVLPLRLLNFTAVKSGNNGILNWTVENQSNINDHFEIERSFNGVSFDKMGSVAVINNGPTGTYSFTDLDIVSTRNNGVIYYRIKQVDKDGQFVYSDVRSIRLNPGKVSLGLYPNPANIYSTLTMDLPDAMQVSVIVSDAGGRVIDQYSISGNKGMNQKRLDLSKYASGSYMMKIQAGNESQTLTLVKAQ